MQPTGMSLRRCVAALDHLRGELERIELSGNDATTKATLPGALQPLIQNLALEIDLRNGTTSQSPMSKIESEVYFPLIEKVVTLLRVAQASESGLLPVAKAKELIQEALRTAVHRASESQDCDDFHTP